VVDNTQDEDWENVALTLTAGLPISFVHDLYTPRYKRRSEIQVCDVLSVGLVGRCALYLTRGS
jgi:hypothetical protein